jgi:hypothetical protein
MSEALPMSEPTISEDTRNATSSQASLFGVTPCDSPDGRMTDQCGPEAVPVPPSRVQAKAKGLTTLVTSGRYGSHSSASVALESSLVSNLMTRLDSAGSTLFNQTWKRRTTPLRRRYWEHTALGQATSVSGCTSVPTPCCPNGGRSVAPEKMDATGRTVDGRKHTASLEHTVKLGSVPTPMAGSPATETYNAAGNNDYSRKIVELASVPTPNSEGDTTGGGVDPDGSIRSRLDQLPRQAQLAASHGTSNRVLKLRGYGDAIIPQVAQAFIESYLETRKEL